MDPLPPVSVVVPVRDGGADFARCLRSLAACRPAPAEIVVVDDGGTDGSADLASRSGAVVLRREAPGGPAAARNLGARKARHGIVLFVDADVAVHPDAIARVAATLAAEPALAAVFGSYDDAPAAPDFLSQYRNLLHHFVHQNSREEASTFWAGCGAVRRETFLAAGGFDERYERPSVEDIELGYRLASSGKRILLLKDLQATHLKRWRPLSLLRTDVLRRAVPWTDLILGRRRLANDLNLDTGGRVSAILAVCLAICLAGAFWKPRLLAAAAIPAAGLVAVNADFYGFLLRRRGWWFTFRALPWHWFYFLYAVVSFAAALVTYRFRHPRGRPGPLSRPLVKP